MIGAVAGDVIGSRWEFGGCKTKDFPLFGNRCRPTDDTMMSLAIAEAILKSRDDPSRLGYHATWCMRRWGRNYPDSGFGGSFFEWLYDTCDYPYYSFGNGSAMRVSPVAWAAESLEETLEMAKTVSEVTHNHPDGIKGGQAVAAAVFMARKGSSKDEIRACISENFYPLDKTIDEIRPTYKALVACCDSVPQAIEAFLESDSFEDAVRNAVSLGGDSDTQACMAGAIAEAFYGVPEDIREQTLARLDRSQKEMLLQFEAVYGRGSCE